MSRTAERMTCPKCQGRAYRVRLYKDAKRRGAERELIKCRGRCAQPQEQPK